LGGRGGTGATWVTTGTSTTGNAALVKGVLENIMRGHKREIGGGEYDLRETNRRLRMWGEATGGESCQKPQSREKTRVENKIPLSKKERI